MPQGQGRCCAVTNAKPRRARQHQLGLSQYGYGHIFIIYSDSNGWTLDDMAMIMDAGRMVKMMDVCGTNK